MPPRGYNRQGRSDKPTIPAQLKGTVQGLLGGSKPSVGSAPAPKSIVQLFSGADPDIVNNKYLQKQPIPAGWEALTSIPEWATTGTTGKFEHHYKERINPTTLTHAIRLKGTNHILTSEAMLSGPELERAAKDYKTATDAIGHMFPDGVAMHVPNAANYNSSSRGFMRMSGLMQTLETNGIPARRTFYMNPETVIRRTPEMEKTQQAHSEGIRNWNWVAAKREAEAMGDPVPDKNGTQFGWQMPASQKNRTAYTMVHEMVHILDDMNSHTGDHGQASQANKAKARSFHKKVKGRLSEYGRSKVVEGYAEAGAQWFFGGPGSSDVADEYAKEYGWRAR